MNSRVAQLFSQIQDSQTELAQIRATCNHPTYKVCMYMWRPGAFQPQRICDECLDVVAGITEEEAAPLWEERNSHISSGVITQFNN